MPNPGQIQVPLGSPSGTIYEASSSTTTRRPRRPRGLRAVPRPRRLLHRSRARRHPRLRAVLAGRGVRRPARRPPRCPRLDDGQPRRRHRELLVQRRLWHARREQPQHRQSNLYKLALAAAHYANGGPEFITATPRRSWSARSTVGRLHPHHPGRCPATARAPPRPPGRGRPAAGPAIQPGRGGLNPAGRSPRRAELRGQRQRGHVDTLVVAVEPTAELAGSTSGLNSPAPSAIRPRLPEEHRVR